MPLADALGGVRAKFAALSLKTTALQRFFPPGDSARRLILPDVDQSLILLGVIFPGFLSQIYHADPMMVTMGGDLQPDCLADRPVIGPRQPT
eukprot:1151967-Pelagomonas_calceolata.AAC.1